MLKTRGTVEKLEKIRNDEIEKPRIEKTITNIFDMENARAAYSTQKRG